MEIGIHPLERSKVMFSWKDYYVENERRQSQIDSDFHLKDKKIQLKINISAVNAKIP